MGILDSNPDTGTVQTDSAPNLDDKSVAELFAMEEEADEANPNPVASEAPVKKPGKQAEEDGEPEAVEAESEEVPEAEESDDQEDEPDAQADSTTIEIDGKRWTRDELKASIMMQADYTRKTQEVAEQRKAMDTAVERLSKQDEKAKADLGFAMSVLQAILPPEPDPSIIPSDPVGYMQAKAQRDQAMAVIRQLQGQQAAYNQQQQEQTREQSARALQSEWQAAVQKLPELAAPEGRQKFREEAIKYGKEWGLEPSEIDGIESSKALLVLKDAIEFRKLKANAPKAVQTAKAAPKMARPGTREQPAGTPLARLQKLGSDPKASVADIFAAMEED